MENTKEEVPSVLLPKTLETLSSALMAPVHANHPARPLYGFHQNRSQTRSMHATIFERFSLLKVLANYANILDGKDTDSRTSHKRSELWTEVANKMNETGPVIRNRHQVQTLYKNMKAKAKRYQTRLQEEGEDAVERDEVSEELLKMLDGEHQMKRYNMQRAALLANIVNQDKQLCGPSTSTPTTIASNVQQILQGLHMKKFMKTDVPTEMAVSPHHDLSKFLKQEMHLPPSPRFLFTNSSDDGCSGVSNSSNNSNDSQNISGPSSVNGNVSQLKEEPNVLPLPLTVTVSETQQVSKKQPVEVVDMESEEGPETNLTRKWDANDVLTEGNSSNIQQSPERPISPAHEPNYVSPDNLGLPLSLPNVEAPIVQETLVTENPVLTLHKSDELKMPSEDEPPAKRQKLTDSTENSSTLAVDAGISDQQNGPLSEIPTQVGEEESSISTVRVPDEQAVILANDGVEVQENIDQENNVQVDQSQKEPDVTEMIVTDEVKTVQADDACLNLAENPKSSSLPEMFVGQEDKIGYSIKPKEMTRMARIRHRLQMKILRNELIASEELIEHRRIEHSLQVKILKAKLQKHQSGTSIEEEAA